MTRFIRVNGKLVNPKHQAKPKKPIKARPSDILHEAQLNARHPGVNFPGLTHGVVFGDNSDYFSGTGTISDG